MRHLYQTLHPDSLGYYVAAAIACVILYAYLAALVRVTGIRTVSRLSGFDFVVTIALGTIFGMSLLDDRLPEGVVILTVVAGLHLFTHWLASRWPAFARMVLREPAVLVRDGRPIEAVLRRERISRGELESAARAAGCGSIDELALATLEPDGSISVVPRPYIHTPAPAPEEHEYETR